MSDITKKITYGELENKEYQALFKFTNGETVLGVINYDNGDVYMGEIKPDEKYDGKRDRRRHGYGKVFPKRGKVVDGEWYLGQVVGKSVTFDKKGKRTVEVRGSDPSFRSILYSYYLTDDNKYGGDNYNGLYKDKFWDGDFKDVLRRGELREQLFGGTVPTTTASTSAQKSAPTKEKAPAKKNAVPKEPASKAKIERIEFDNGDVYEGEMVNGLRHGKGKYTWANGDFYEGEWAKGWRSGFGIYKSYSKNEKDGSTYTSYTYEGEWKNSKKHGHGVATGYKAFPVFGHIYMSWSYDGPWVDDKKHGCGIYREWDGNALSEHWKVYEGEWIDDKRHGLFVWRPEPAAKDLKYIDYYDHGKTLVRYIDYDPSIKTLEDAQRAKETEREENERVMDERRAREAAQSRTSKASTTSSDPVYVSSPQRIAEASAKGTIFTVWESIDPSAFDEKTAVESEGILADTVNRIMRAEITGGYAYVKPINDTTAIYLYITNDYIRERYTCNNKIMSKEYAEKPDGTGFFKKEMYLDKDDKQIGYAFAFEAGSAQGVYTLEDCCTLSNEKWKFYFALDPEDN